MLIKASMKCLVLECRRDQEEQYTGETLNTMMKGLRFQAKKFWFI